MLRQSIVGSSRAEGPLVEPGLDLRLEFEQAQQVGHGGTGFSDGLGDLLVGQSKLLEQAMQGAGFLEKLFRKDLSNRPPKEADEAYSTLRRLVDRYPASEYAPDAEQRMIHLKNRLSDYENTVADYYLGRRAYIAAANRARYALEVYPETPMTPEALIVLHKAYTELDLPQLAESSMAVLQLNFPDNYYVQGRKKKRTWAERLWPFD